MPRSAAVIIVLSLMGALLWAMASCRATQPTPAEPTATAPVTPPPAQPAPVQAPAPAPAPAQPTAEKTITNAPALGGSMVLDLPPLAPGEVRSIVDGDGSFTITADGDLARGYTAIPLPTTKLVTVRSVVGSTAPTDSVHRIAVTTAAWSPEAFPEMIVQSLTQEGLAAPGPVAQAEFGGLAALTGRNKALSAEAGHEPVKLAAGAGISFFAGRGSKLSFKPEGEALLLDRWSLVIFRAEAGPGKKATLLTINDGPLPQGRSGYWLPRLEFDAITHAVVASYCGDTLHQVRSPAGSVLSDGHWNVALTYRRQGRLFLSINGTDCGPTGDSFSAARPEGLTESRIGDAPGDTAGWALDGLWVGQSELSERTVAKLEAWALARAAALPGGAAASAAFTPVVDADDFPHRYLFDPVRYAAWKVANPKEQRVANQGKPASSVQPDRSGWVRVFHDDFRTPANPGARALNGSSVGDSTADIDAGRQIWFAPGTNSAVGGKAICKDGNDRPFKEAYVLDAKEQTLALRLYCTDPPKDGKPGRWRNGQFTSVNDSGVGYAWGGAKGFKVRAKLNGAGPGVFPCPIWFYSLEHLFWRTSERIEFDVIELDDGWDNYGASHVHNGPLKGLFGHSGVDTMKKSTVPEELRSLKLTAGKQLCGVNAWDGKFHTWEVWIEDDLTYLNIDGMEVARVTTIPEYREKLFMYIDTSLKDEKGMDPKKSYDLVLDSVEAFRPATTVDVVPGAPFTARPTLSGAADPGSTITCAANLTGCSDVWYYWHVDGYPRGFSTSNTYTVLPADRGASIRCMVKAVGAKDQPEAWTAALPVR